MPRTVAWTPDPIRFFHRGRVVEVEGAAPTRTVLDWLREDARCTGTKEGCAEGDCGACTVIVAELADRGGLGTAAARRPSSAACAATVNACIQFLPTLDGKALLTRRRPGGDRRRQLHPAQQAMVECHGSQCGFCTPGFVMSLAATYERHSEAGTTPTRQQLADELSGNLCRCTGYRPILDAGQRMFELPAHAAGHRADRRAAEALRADAPLHYAAPNPAAAPARSAATIPRAAHARRSWPRCARRARRRACWPAAPTSACGSTSSSATWARSSTWARWPS